MNVRSPKPKWLSRRLPPRGQSLEISNMLEDLALHTVCQEAVCPNMGECYGQGTATFLLLGPDCTRSCTFCAVGKTRPAAPDPSEPGRTAEAVKRMKLTFCVLTMVTRDDLPDGGARHVADTITAIRKACPDTGVELLVSDLGGMEDALEIVVSAGAETLNHNLETVPRLYETVRPEAGYERSLTLLSNAAKAGAGQLTKSGLMLGLGETREEILATMDDLIEANCRMLTLGQYLAPSASHHPVVRYLEPGEFDELKGEALSRGFKAVASGPYVRSSYQAEQLFDLATGKGAKFKRGEA